MAQRVVDVERLTPDEQLELIGELWENLSKKPEDVPLTDAQRTEIDLRSDELDEDLRAGRPLGIPWEDVFRRLRAYSADRERRVRDRERPFRRS
jgi:putative addiction module component (TIGR02574 family)